MAETRQLVQRHQIVTFYNTGTYDVPVWTRMKGFTNLPATKDTITYTRHYVDEKNETSDAVGMGETREFELDYYKNDPVHSKILSVYTEETLGAEADLLEVDFSKLAVDSTPKEYNGRRRTYSVIPDTMADGVEAYKLTGSFVAKSAITKVVVTAEQAELSQVVTIKTTVGV